MSINFNPRKKTYDLYSFDAPYDLEKMSFSEALRLYGGGSDINNNSKTVETEDEEDEFKNLDLTLEEAEQDRHFPTPEFRLINDKNRTDSERLSSPPVLGTTLSQRKKLLSERIEELIADISKREKLEEQMLEKAELETYGLKFLLDGTKNFSLGSYPSIDMRRTNLEREILALKKAGWDEQLRCWRDIIALKKELREVLEEYHLILAAEDSKKEGD